MTKSVVLAIVGSAFVLSACGGGSGSSQGGGAAAVPDTMPSGANGGTPSGGTASTDPTNPLGATCAGGTAGTKYCVGLKYVVFEESDGTPSATQATVVSNVAAINQIWASCSINFQLEQYQAVSPTADNLSANGDSETDMNAMRSAFVDNSHFLIVSLYGTVSGADAWTEEAGSGAPYGTILDDNVVTYVPVIAHEMGHYMGLEHVTDSTNLMYPSPYPNPTLTSDQCSTVTSTLQSEWSAMLR